MHVVLLSYICLDRDTVPLTCAERVVFVYIPCVFPGLHGREGLADSLAWGVVAAVNDSEPVCPFGVSRSFVCRGVNVAGEKNA